MKEITLNPTGNVWDRFVACWFMFWYPQTFARAFTHEVFSMFMAKVAQVVPSHEEVCPEQIQPAQEPKSAEQLEFELEAAATAAQSEATNG